MYIVRTQQFEGPMDVLLSLIEKKKMDISQLSLSLVTDQFVSYVETSKEISLDTLADFLVVAAKLLVIKSRTLLPSLEEEIEEDDAIDLESQLKEYKRYKEASEILCELFESKNTLFRRTPYMNIQSFLLPKSSEIYNFGSEDIRSAFLNTLSRMPDPRILKKKVMRSVVSLEEKIHHIRAIIEKRTSGTFFQLIGKAPQAEDVTVSFLAVLELSRSRLITLRQEEYFGDIILERKNSD